MSQLRHLREGGLEVHGAHVSVLAQFPAPGNEPVKLICGGDGAVLTYGVAPVSGGGLATVTFKGIRKIVLGHPNDEALGGHRFASHGLTWFAFHEVSNSDLIADLKHVNRVHPRHTDELFAGLRHFIATFKEETFECVARTLEVSHSKEAEVA